MKKSKMQLTKMLKTNKNLLIAVAVIAVVLTASIVAGGNGEQLQGYLKRPTIRTIRPYTGTAAYTSIARPAAPVQATVARATFVKMVVDKKGIDVSSYKGCTARYANTWMETYVCYLTVAKGYQNAENIDYTLGLNRAEAAKMLWQIAYPDVPLLTSIKQLYPDVAPNQWYYGYIMTLNRLRIVTGAPDGFFKPAELLSLADANLWVSRIK